MSCTGRTRHPVCKTVTPKAERFAVETHHFRIQHHTHTTAACVRHAHITRPQGATTKRQSLIETSRSAGVRESGLASAIALGSGWPTGIQTQTKGQNQPTGYYHQAPAMNWSAGVVVGFGLALAIDAAARVQHTYKTRPPMKGDLAVS